MSFVSSESDTRAWDNIAKEMWDMELIKPFKAFDRPNQQRLGAPRIFRIPESLMAEPECPCHNKIFLPWLLPLKKSAGHKYSVMDLEHVSGVFRTHMPSSGSMVPHASRGHSLGAINA
ncbi:hypothetical protein BS47DRAFT_1356280 [Hydnum rufescens UP504]|uniref:Uncharacterized protein n=1 Tax=Hydnum rufescens UP504 TaxID=1448309 RepID=A0A9P6ACF8_9AGAM|nr:hypothetical protein BS47DRAFT_1356280 [Hydnum rufescens UP504]